MMRRFFSHTQVAAYCGSASHAMSSTGRFRCRDSTALSTPVSTRILEDTCWAARLASSSRQYRRASTRRSALSFLCGIGLDPAPTDATIPPQKGWLEAKRRQKGFECSSGQFQETHSPKNGTMIVGRALTRPHAVVPAPPWCTTTDTRLKSHSDARVSFCIFA